MSKSGASISSAFDAIFKGKRRNIGPMFRNLLQLYGDRQITRLAVTRVPIHSVLQKIINVITMGKFNDNLAKLSYDQVFHLSLVVELNDVVLALEKDAVPKLEIFNPKNRDGLVIEINGPLTLATFIQTTIDKIGLHNYVHYNASSLNCQKFVLDHLEANGLTSAGLENYIMQDAAALLNNDPLVIGAFEKLTDIGALVDLAIHGQSIRGGDLAQMGGEVMKFFRELFAILAPPEFLKNDQITSQHATKRGQDGARLFEFIKQ